MALGEVKGASAPTVRRLPLYLRFLLQLRTRGREVVSCTHIANELKLDPTQIRKDLAVTGIIGKPKVGYFIDELIGAVESYLGWNNTTNAFLVGAGSLGRALLGDGRFHRSHGIDIIAAFDTDPNKAGHEIAGKEVLALDKFESLVKRLQVHIGIITVPSSAAQETANLMMASGIRAIWNFAPCKLDVAEGVIVENVDLSSSLAVLSQKLALLFAEEQKANAD